MEFTLKDLKEIGKRIHDERTSLGVSVYKLSQMSGVATNLITRIEAGECRPRTDTLVKIGEMLDTLKNK